MYIFTILDYNYFQVYTILKSFQSRVFHGCPWVPRVTPLSHFGPDHEKVCVCNSSKFRYLFGVQNIFLKYQLTFFAKALIGIIIQGRWVLCSWNRRILGGSEACKRIQVPNCLLEKLLLKITWSLSGSAELLTFQLNLIHTRHISISAH